jgi:hypothetical protein
VFAFSAAVDVNPPGATPVLERAAVWRGLVMKAENALPFVPGMQSCTVLEHHAGGLVREVVVRGERFIERVTFTPEVAVLFERTDPARDAPAGWITNVISESEHGLLLTFTFAVVLPEARPGSADEQQGADVMKASYVEAIKATLAAMRRIVLEGSPT